MLIYYIKCYWGNSWSGYAQRRFAIYAAVCTWAAMRDGYAGMCMRNHQTLAYDVCVYVRMCVCAYVRICICVYVRMCIYNNIKQYTYDNI